MVSNGLSSLPQVAAATQEATPRPSISVEFYCPRPPDYRCIRVDHELMDVDGNDMWIGEVPISIGLTKTDFNDKTERASQVFRVLISDRILYSANRVIFNDISTRYLCTLSSYAN